jgi:hypothetical protein
MDNHAQRLLVEAKILPEVMPGNFTFNKVREILQSLERASEESLREAIEAAEKLNIRGALAITIFIKHHLEGEHKVEVDRMEEGEEGARFAVLVYTEGEVPLPVESLPSHVDAGVRLRYAPSEWRYL